jgi:hypothetical protein
MQTSISTVEKFRQAVLASATVIAALLGMSNAIADQTTGGVNWLDPLAYRKPAFVPITVPGTAVATYYIDGTSGSDGGACSQSSPCKYLANVCGKAGMTGGPVFVYIKGNVSSSSGNYLFQATNCYGSQGSEIYVRPWPGSTASLVSSGANAIGAGSGAAASLTYPHDWIFDGGPNMGITIVVPNGSDPNNIGMRVNALRFTFYRVRVTCNNGTNASEGIMTTAAGVADLRVINSEFYDCPGNSGLQGSAIYLAGDVCNGASSYSNFLFQNNIVRNMGGEGVEVNPRVDSPGAVISGNAFHHIGFTTCGGSWQCRPAITVGSCGGTPSGNQIYNNIMWDIAASCVWAKAGDIAITNNTCYDFGKQANGNGTGGTIAQVEGIAVGNSGNAGNVTTKNNIFFSVVGKNPFDSTSLATNASNNICATGKSCGASSVAWSANTVVSVTENSANYLQIATSSNANGAGINLFSSGVTQDYAGVGRLSAGLFDIGAFLINGGLSAPPNLRVVP